MSRLLLVVASWVLGGFLWTTMVAAATVLPDTRVLIDISGSMKNNDPKNLRQPALRLLVGLLPKDSRAGVWTFGQYVNMLVPLGKVDEGWRRRAREGAGKVHSRGLFTNIEEALERATSDWNRPADGVTRHLVLLTDGMVDISQDVAESTRSRQRILERELPRLRDLGVRIHTVALSDRADHELMQRLSRVSGGWYEQAQNAAALQKVFLRIFEQVGNPDTVPLKDNRFNVDRSIREVTLIVFRPPGVAPTRIIMPSGEQFEHASAPAGVTWHQDEGYDLLTVVEPMAGEWTIQAQVDPDNRAMILTDLRMQVSALPNRILAGQRIPMTVEFEDQGKLVARREFVDVMQMTAEQIGPEGLVTEPRPVGDDGRGEDPLAYDGRFEMRFEPRGGPGRGELVLVAEGKTFQREKRLLFELDLPVQVTLDPDSDQGSLLLKVSPNAEVVAPATVEASADLALVDGTHRTVDMERLDSGSFRGVLDLTQIPGVAQLTVRVRARTLGGDTLGSELPPMPIAGQQAVPQLPEKASAAAPMAVMLDPAEAITDQSGNGDSNILMWFGIANLVVFLVAGLAFWIIRRRRGTDLIELVDEQEVTQGAKTHPPEAAGEEEAA